mgnify:CR=1 FL=1
MKIALVVEYDGTNYKGFQYQSDFPTIQEEIEKAIHKFTGESLRVSGAGRTDAGVHALGQVVSFKTLTNHSTDTIVNALNFYLPGDGRFDHDGKSHIAQMEVDYLLVPINDTNLGVGFAALLTYILQPRVVVPCHYGYTHPPVRSQAGHPAEFVTALAARGYDMPTTDIVILSPGGRLVLA